MWMKVEKNLKRDWNRIKIQCKTVVAKATTYLLYNGLTS